MTKPIHLLELTANCPASTFLFTIQNSDNKFTYVYCSLGTIPACSCWSYLFNHSCKHTQFVTKNLLCMSETLWKRRTKTFHGGRITMSEAFLNIILPRLDNINLYLHPSTTCMYPVKASCVENVTNHEVSQCIICIEEDQNAKVKCQTCSCLIHRSCWSEYLLYCSVDKTIKCPQCRKAFLTDASIQIDYEVQFMRGRQISIVSPRRLGIFF
jgi:hypothetical protein